MPNCELCNSFVKRRMTALKDITKLPYTEDEKKMIYYSSAITDEDFDQGVKVCSKCYTECNKTTKGCGEDIEKFVSTQAPREKENRMKRNQNLGKKFNQVQVDFLKQSKSCKVCDFLNNKRKNLNKFTDKELEQEMLECRKCWNLCN